MNIVASRKFKFWLRRVACAMAKTKAMCIIIINRTNKLIGVQHEKEKQVNVNDGTFDKCAYVKVKVKDDDDLCA